MKRVIIESPFRGADANERQRNVEYLQRCIHDSLSRGEAPFASHGLYPGALDEDKPDERQWGIEAGFAWWDAADLIAFYTDHQWSPGMLKALNRAEALKKPVAHRHLGMPK